MTDFHIHILPDVDDGAANVSESAIMLEVSAAQGITQVVATPHYIPHRQSIKKFLKARKNALNEILEEIVPPPGMEISLGAEVYIEQRLCEEILLPELTLAGSDYILLEPPYSSYKSWIEDEIHNVIYGYKLTPVIAHIERYLSWYSKNDIERLLNIEGIVLQVNAEAFSHRKLIKFVLSLIEDGRTVILGSDAHNMSSRPPKLDLAYDVLKARLDKSVFQNFLTTNDELLGEYL